jgi:predicted Zn-dependent protease
MIEQNSTWYFSIDSANRRERLYKKRHGLLRRSFDGGAPHTCRSIEYDAGAPAIGGAEISFNPGKILGETGRLMETLRQLAPAEWKIIFRASAAARLITINDSKEKKSEFRHYSILVKLRLHDRRDFIEVGEGSVQGPKFNIDGLCSRTRKIVDNHRRAVFPSFPGKVPVILSAGDGAIIFHEILGHSLEADYIHRRQSPVSPDDIGKPIVSPNVTLTTGDAGDNFFKTTGCDDEGEAPRSLTLVENGVLRHLIADNFYKNRLNIEDRGHCRVEDFRKNPMPRMYALYVQPGDYDPGELIAAAPYGVYANEFGEGKVYFERNIFYFHIRDAWLIEKGKRSTPLGAIMVRGNIFEVLNSVDMVANDFRFDRGTSYCFKNGQTINVRVGQPTVKIGNLYIARAG